MKLYQAKITWYNQDAIDINQDPKMIDYVVIAGETMTMVQEEIADYYGEDCLDTVEITVLSTTRPMLFIPKDCYDTLYKEGDC